MRSTRVDLWLPIGDAVYRLNLSEPLYEELERSMGCGFTRLYGAGLEEAGPESAATAPAAHYALALRLALVGGGMGVRNSVTFKVTPVLATQVADAVAAQPLAVVVRIVRTFLHACIHGRPATQEEQAAFSIPQGPPIVPAWALEYRFND